MAKIDAGIKEEIARLNQKDLIKLVIKAATTDKTFFNYLMVHYLDKNNGEQILFDEAKSDLQVLFRKSYKGFSEELQLANMLAACNKRINEFAKVCTDKSLEMELIMFVLEIPFSSTEYLGTCFTKYDHQVFLLVKKAITLLKNKLHEDFYIQYAPKLNEYLAILHRTSNHLDYIYSFPDTV